MAKTPKSILLAYNKCADLAIKLKNILDSFWHKDEKIPLSALAQTVVTDVSTKLDKGGYTGTANDLKLLIDNIAFLDKDNPPIFIDSNDADTLKDSLRFTFKGGNQVDVSIKDLVDLGAFKDVSKDAAGAYKLNFTTLGGSTKELDITNWFAVPPYIIGTPIPDSSVPFYRKFNDKILLYHGDYPSTITDTNPLDASSEWYVMGFSKNNFTDYYKQQVDLNIAKRHNPTVLPQPILNSIEPPNLMPGVRGLLTFKGEFWTDEITLLIPNHTIHLDTLKVVSSNEFKVEVTAPVVEQNYDVTIRGKVFKDAFIVNLGNVFVPKTNEWALTQPVTALNDTISTNIYDTLGTAIWSKEISHAVNFKILFNFKTTPLGLAKGDYRITNFDLINVSNGSRKYGITVYQNNGFAYKILIYKEAVYPAQVYVGPFSTYSENFNHISLKGLEFSYVGGVFKWFYDGVKRYEDINTLSENLKIKVSVSSFDVENIKYIELS